MTVLFRHVNLKKVLIQLTSAQNEVLKANPDLKGFTGVASTDCPGIAKAVEELGLDVKVVGVGTPNEFKPYVESGTISTIKLWDPKDSGYIMCKLLP